MVEKQSIPDETLWKMLNTGASFRQLSTILDLAFTTVKCQNNFHTSSSHLFKSYQRLLQSKEAEYKLGIQHSQSYGTICFDHQSTRKLTGKYEGNSHRLAIVWYSDGKHNVIGMPEMPNKTAGSQLVAIRQSFEDFGIENDQVVALTCDNENTNTGIHRGTCTMLENALNKPLLRLMCRHHILEIIIKDVYNHLFTSDTPNNIFYLMLRGIWAELRENDFSFEPFNEDNFFEDMDLEAYEAFVEMKNMATTDLISHSRSKHVRDDYKEVTLLALKFLGKDQITTKKNQVKFRTLINPSNARFMASIIQGIECFLFRGSLEWDTQDLLQLKKNIKRFAMFASLIYIRYWNRCSILFDAPINDLSFLQEIQKYQLIDSSVAEVAMSALTRHLYYLSEELAPLSLFSEKVSNREKNRISEKLRLAQDDMIPTRKHNGNDPSNHIALSEIIMDWNTKSVADLIGERSNFFLDAMNLPRSFLTSDASEWSQNRDFLIARETVMKSLICINDGSERVISNCKSKLSKQRCRKESTFRQNMLSLNNNV